MKLLLVEARWSHVVGALRMEHAGQVLDLATSRTQLELPAPVHGDAVRMAMLVDRQELCHRSKPGRLDVDTFRREGQGEDVFRGVQDGIPGDAAPVGKMELCILLTHLM